MTADDVVHLYVFVLGHFEADNPLVAALDACLDFVGREGKRCLEVGAYGAIVGKGFALGFGLFAEAVQLLGTVESIVGPAVIYELLSILKVNLFAFALTIGGMRSTLFHTLIGLNAAPFEALDYVSLGTRHKALAVGIFNTQNEVAFVLASKKIIIECCADTSDVECSGGTGCKTYPDAPIL